MALNLATFKTRTITAVVFVIIMLAGLLWNHWSFFVLFSIIHFGCWLEYQRLIGLLDTEYSKISPFHKYGVMIAGWCIMLAFTNDAFRIFGVRLHAIGWWLGLVFMFVLPLIELLFATNIRLKNIGFSAAGLVYISLSLGLMIDLRSQGIGELFGSKYDVGWIIPLMIIASIWINDTMAYIVGSLIGKTPFSKISPKKTWEGTVGGMILAILFIGLVFPLIVGGYFENDLVGIPANTHVFIKEEGTVLQAGYHWFVIPAIAAIAGTAGDLFESKLKRMANVKDSGHIMPGHGGFLDRFDSLLFAVPFVWIYVKLFL
jgi:phosphatidate cytidylyltransferase